MQLSLSRQSDRVLVASLTSGDDQASTVVDTAAGTQPVPLDRWVADQGGVRPVTAPARAGEQAPARSGGMSTPSEG